jgi:hypothetical protein
MPLSDSLGRTALHHRQIDLRGYRRSDGLYEVDGRVVDTKTYAIDIDGRTREAGDAIHDMSVRLVVDEQLVVRDVIAVMDAWPYSACSEATSAMTAIIGHQIKAGWSAFVKETLGGSRSCTHLMELLLPMATAAYQTLSSVRQERPDEVDRGGKPVRIDSCYAYAAHRDIVRKRWPLFYNSIEGVRRETLPLTKATP